MISNDGQAVPIFVTGTGRSGTWILYESLGRHPGVHTFPREMRFLVDPDGLLDLIDALTIRYHPGQARESLYRFERLMKVYLAAPENAPYPGFDLPTWLGEAHYWQRLELFLSQLEFCEYEGVTWEAETENEGRLVEWARRLRRGRRIFSSSAAGSFRPGLPRSKRKVAKYFSDRKELASIAGSFVGDLFRNASAGNGKRTWSEKTPQHLLYLDFLWELFPDGCVIHIKRDPRGVVHSMRKQRWAPNDLECTCRLLRNVYDRWFDLRRNLDFEKHRFIEISLEEFASSPSSALEQISCLCGLENSFGALPEIELERVTYWEKEMSIEEIRLVNDVLGHRIELLGYPL